MMNRMLVVDDEEDICLLLTGMLKKMGFETEYAFHLEGAEKLIKENNFDSIFVDLNLPDGVGTDLFPTIRKHQGNIKIIVISAYDNEKYHALEKGANYFISKPFTKKSVNSALEELNITND